MTPCAMSKQGAGAPFIERGQLRSALGSVAVLELFIVSLEVLEDPGEVVVAPVVGLAVLSVVDGE